MFVPVSRVVSRAAQRGLQQQPSRNGASYTDLISSPPTVRISFGEKLGHGLMLAVGLLGYPLYATTKVSAIKREAYEALETPEKFVNFKE